MTERSPGKTEAVRFSLAAIFVGHVAWVEELDGNPLAREQVQLVHAMARAISGEVQRPDVTQFDWPTHQNHQFDLGSEAALAGVAGFLQRQIDQRKCRALVLLGKHCEALAGWDEQIREVYGSLGRVAVELSAAGGNADPEALAAIERMLRSRAGA